MMIPKKRQQELQKLIQELSLESTQIDWNLLNLALTHPSLSTTHNYQQLEFIGDSVVRLIAAEILRENYPDESVGEFAAIRSIMVSDRTLAEFAERLDLENYLLQSEVSAKDENGRISRLADGFEGVLGALYLSIHNMNLIRPWLDKLLIQKAEEIRQDPARQNYKDALQEWTQRKYKCLPQYQVKAVEPILNSEERFISEVWLNQQRLGVGKGRTKKAAEQAAAKEAFLQQNKNNAEEINKTLSH